MGFLKILKTNNNIFLSAKKFEIVWGLKENYRHSHIQVYIVLIAFIPS
jgi:hypothetical protein